MNTKQTGRFYRKVSRLFRKSIALFVSFSFIFLDSVVYAQVLPNAIVSSKTFNIPEALGTVEESFITDSKKTIFFIQDAHDSLEAQVNIAKIINHTVDHYGVKTVFEEGYEGRVPSDEYFGFIHDPVIKERVSYYLLDQLRIGGAEYAHINRKKEFKLVGVDNLKLHAENIQWYQKAIYQKKIIQEDLIRLQRELDVLIQRYFPKDFKSWLKIYHKYQKEELNILDYLKRSRSIYQQLISAHQFQAQYPMTVSILSAFDGEQDSFPKVQTKEFFNEVHRLEDDLALAFLARERDQKIYTFYRNLALVQRLSDFKVTQAEYESIRTMLDEFDTESIAPFVAKHSKKSIVLSKAWESSLENAIRFYEAAKQRDRSVEAYLRSYADGSATQNAVLVFGGFHKNQIREILKRNNISYYIVNPIIKSLSERHQKIYQTRMSQGYDRLEQTKILNQAARNPSDFAILRTYQNKKDVYREDLARIARTTQALQAWNSDATVLDIQLALQSGIEQFENTSRSELRSVTSTVSLNPAFKTPEHTLKEIIQKSMRNDQSFHLVAKGDLTELPELDEGFKTEMQHIETIQRQTLSNVAGETFEQAEDWLFERPDEPVPLAVVSVDLKTLNYLGNREYEIPGLADHFRRLLRENLSEAYAAVSSGDIERSWTSTYAGRIVMIGVPYRWLQANLHRVIKKTEDEITEYYKTKKQEWHESDAKKEKDRFEGMKRNVMQIVAKDKKPDEDSKDWLEREIASEHKIHTKKMDKLKQDLQNFQRDFDQKIHGLEFYASHALIRLKESPPEADPFGDWAALDRRRKLEAGIFDNYTQADLEMFDFEFEHFSETLSRRRDYEKVVQNFKDALREFLEEVEDFHFELKDFDNWSVRKKNKYFTVYDRYLAYRREIIFQTASFWMAENQDGVKGARANASRYIELILHDAWVKLNERLLEFGEPEKIENPEVRQVMDEALRNSPEQIPILDDLNARDHIKNALVERGGEALLSEFYKHLREARLNTLSLAAYPSGKISRPYHRIKQLKEFARAFQESVDALRRTRHDDSKALTEQLSKVEEAYRFYRAAFTEALVLVYRDPRLNQIYRYPMIHQAVQADAQGLWHDYKIHLEKWAASEQNLERQKQIMGLADLIHPGVFVFKRMGGDEVGILVRDENDSYGLIFVELNSANAHNKVYRPDQLDSVFHEIFLGYEKVASGFVGKGNFQQVASQLIKELNRVIRQNSGRDFPTTEKLESGHHIERAPTFVLKNNQSSSFATHFVTNDGRIFSRAKLGKPWVLAEGVKENELTRFLKPFMDGSFIYTREPISKEAIINEPSQVQDLFNEFDELVAEYLKKGGKFVETDEGARLLKVIEDVTDRNVQSARSELRTLNRREWLTLSAAGIFGLALVPSQSFGQDIRISSANDIINRATSIAQKPFKRQVKVEVPSLDQLTETQTAQIRSSKKIFDIVGTGWTPKPRLSNAWEKFTVYSETTRRNMFKEYVYDASDLNYQVIPGLPATPPLVAQHWAQIDLFAPKRGVASAFPTLASIRANGYMRLASAGGRSVPDTVFGASERGLIQQGTLGVQNAPKKIGESFPELTEVFIKRPTPRQADVYQIFENENAVMMRHLSFIVGEEITMNVSGVIIPRKGQTITSEMNVGMGFSSMYWRGAREGFNAQNAHHDSDTVKIHYADRYSEAFPIPAPLTHAEGPWLINFDKPEDGKKHGRVVGWSLEQRNQNSDDFPADFDYAKRASFFISNMDWRLVTSRNRRGSTVPIATDLILLPVGEEKMNMDNVVMRTVLKPTKPITDRERVTFSYKMTVKRATEPKITEPFKKKDENKPEAKPVEKEEVQIAGQPGVIRHGNATPGSMTEIKAPNGVGFHYKNGAGDYGGAYVDLSIEKAKGRTLRWTWKQVDNTNLPKKINVKLEAGGKQVFQQVLTVDPNQEAVVILPDKLPKKFRFVLINEALQFKALNHPVSLIAENFYATRSEVRKEEITAVYVPANVFMLPPKGKEVFFRRNRKHIKAINSVLAKHELPLVQGSEELKPILGFDLSGELKNWRPELPDEIIKELTQMLNSKFVFSDEVELAKLVLEDIKDPRKRRSFLETVAKRLRIFEDMRGIETLSIKDKYESLLITFLQRINYGHFKQLASEREFNPNIIASTEALKKHVGSVKIVILARTFLPMINAFLEKYKSEMEKSGIQIELQGVQIGMTNGMFDGRVHEQGDLVNRRISAVSEDAYLFANTVTQYYLRGDSKLGFVNVEPGKFNLEAVDAVARRKNLIQTLKDSDNTEDRALAANALLKTTTDPELLGQILLKHYFTEPDVMVRKIIAKSFHKLFTSEVDAERELTEYLSEKTAGKISSLNADKEFYARLIQDLNEPDLELKQFIIRIMNIVTAKVKLLEKVEEAVGQADVPTLIILRRVYKAYLQLQDTSVKRSREEKAVLKKHFELSPAEGKILEEFQRSIPDDIKLQAPKHLPDLLKRAHISEDGLLSHLILKLEYTDAEGVMESDVDRLIEDAKRLGIDLTKPWTIKDVDQLKQQEAQYLEPRAVDQKIKLTTTPRSPHEEMLEDMDDITANPWKELEINLRNPENQKALSALISGLKSEDQAELRKAVEVAVIQTILPKGKEIAGVGISFRLPSGEVIVLDFRKKKEETKRKTVKIEKDPKKDESGFFRTYFNLKSTKEGLRGSQIDVTKSRSIVLPGVIDAKISMDETGDTPSQLEIQVSALITILDEAENSIAVSTRRDTDLGTVLEHALKAANRQPSHIDFVEYGASTLQQSNKDIRERAQIIDEARKTTVAAGTILAIYLSPKLHLKRLPRDEGKSPPLIDKNEFGWLENYIDSNNYATQETLSRLFSLMGISIDEATFADDKPIILLNHKDNGERARVTQKYIGLVVWHSGQYLIYDVSGRSYEGYLEKRPDLGINPANIKKIPGFFKLAENQTDVFELDLDYQGLEELLQPQAERDAEIQRRKMQATIQSADPEYLAMLEKAMKDLEAELQKREETDKKSRSEVRFGSDLSDEDRYISVTRSLIQTAKDQALLEVPFVTLRELEKSLLKTDEMLSKTLNEMRYGNRARLGSLLERDTALLLMNVKQTLANILQVQADKKQELKIKDLKKKQNIQNLNTVDTIRRKANKKKREARKIREKYPRRSEVRHTQGDPSRNSHIQFLTNIQINNAVRRISPVVKNMIQLDRQTDVKEVMIVMTYNAAGNIAVVALAPHLPVPGAQGITHRDLATAAHLEDGYFSVMIQYEPDNATFKHPAIHGVNVPNKFRNGTEKLFRHVVREIKVQQSSEPTILSPQDPRQSRSEVRVQLDEGMDVLDQIRMTQTPVLAYVSYEDLTQNFSPDQIEEVFALAYEARSKLRLIIYDVHDPLHQKLAPFRQLRHQQGNVWLTSVNAERAFQNTQRDFAKGSKELINIHLSKHNGLKPTALNNTFFFRYNTEDEDSGLLAAALLWADYQAAGRVLDGISQDEEGYLTLIGEYLRSLIHQSQSRLVVAISA